VFIERMSVGLDVHARSFVACGLDTATGEVTRRRLVPSSEAVLGWLRELPGPVAVAYEAGPTGSAGPGSDRGGGAVRGRGAVEGAAASR
jgi:transposase